MATAIFMPKNGMAMEEGKLIKWLKQVGDKVELDEPVMEIETDKITMESEAPASGVILALTANEGDVIPVLQTIGWIGEPGEKIPEAEAAPAAAAAPEAPAQAAAPVAAPVAAAPGGVVLATPYARKLAAEGGISLAEVPPTGRHGEVTGSDVINATPLARRMAAGMGVELAHVAGSGFGGKVTKDDVLSAAAAPASPEGDVEARLPMSGMRKTIADRMYRSHSEIPTVTQDISADVTALMKLRGQINEGREAKISINDFILKACSIAVAEHPLLRTVIEGSELVTKRATNIGFAVATDGGLIVPVIRNADKLSLSKLAAQAKDMANRARSGGLRMDEYSGSCFTVSNMGMYQVDSFTPIINQPDSAILGVCRVRDELALVDGEVAVKKMITLSLTFDHRILDGVTAAQFELRVKELLENPMEILI